MLVAIASGIAAHTLGNTTHPHQKDESFPKPFHVVARSLNNS
jgi:hypothetical protein